MRTLALVSGGLFVLAAVQGPALPAPLARHYAALAAAPSLTVVYTVRTLGEAPSAYKLVLSRPGAFRLTTPGGFTLSDGKTVTTYDAAKKTYREEPYTEAWAKGFGRMPEVAAWSGFFVKDPAGELISANVGASRTVQGAQITEVALVSKLAAVPTTLFIDKKLGIARGLSMKVGEKETLVTATSVEIGKAPLPAEGFAFVAPEGSKKEEAVAAVRFADVQAMINGSCMPCHGGATPRAGIDLSSYAGVMKTVVPGKPLDSLIVKAIHGTGVKKMPIGNHPEFTAEQSKALEAWIAAGAKNE